MILADRIKRIREAKNLTQEDVAFKCNISASAYGQIERKASTSSYDTLCKIAAALDVSLLFLLDIESSVYFEKKQVITCCRTDFLEDYLNSSFK